MNINALANNALLKQRLNDLVAGNATKKYESNQGEISNGIWPSQSVVSLCLTYETLLPFNFFRFEQ
jgi:hypothetical protein